MRLETKIEYAQRRAEEEVKAGNSRFVGTFREIQHSMICKDEDMKRHVAALAEIYVNDVARCLVKNVEYTSFTYDVRYGTGSEYVTGVETINDTSQNIELEVTGLAVPEMSRYLIDRIIERWGRDDGLRNRQRVSEKSL